MVAPLRKNFFKKLEYRFLVEITKIENASFPYKTVRSFKTNRMMAFVTEELSHKEERFIRDISLFSLFMSN